MANKNTIIDPKRTQPTAQGNFTTPNVMGNVGIERQISGAMDKILYQMDEIKMKNEALYNESAFADVEDLALQDIAMMRNNKDYYKDGTKIGELKNKIDTLKEKHRKFALENGYDMRFVDAYQERMDKAYKGAEQVFYNKFTEYSKQLQADNYLLLMDKRNKNNVSLAGVGDLSGASLSYKDNVKNLLAGQKEGYISMEQMINSAESLKKSIIGSYINSFADDVDGALKLSEMANWTDEEINEALKDFNFEEDGYLSMNTSEDFEFFRRSISGAANVIDTRNKASEQATLYEATKQIQYRKENNFAIESKKYPSSIQPWQIGQRVYTDATNNFYGTEFQNIKQASQLGYQIKIIDNSNSQEKFYNDIEVDGVNIINKNLEETQMYVGGWVDEDQRIVTDGMALDYHNRGVKTRYGYNVTKQLQNVGSETSNLLVRTYTPESRKVLQSVETVNLNFSGNFDRYKDLIANPKAGRPITPMAPSIPYGATAQMNTKEPEWEVLIGTEYENDKYTDLSIIGIIEGLEYCGRNGDVNAKATAQDFTNIAGDIFKLMFMEKYGGVLSEDIADELGMDKSAGLFISGMGKEDKNKIFNYALQSDDDLKKEFIKIMEPVAKEILGNTQIGDTGNGRFIRLEGVEDPSKEVRSLNDYMRNNDFIAIVGKNPDGTDKTKIVKGNEIIPVSVAGGQKILMTYNKNPVILNGGVAVYEVGGVN